MSYTQLTVTVSFTLEAGDKSLTCGITKGGGVCLTVPCNLCGFALSHTRYYKELLDRIARLCLAPAQRNLSIQSKSLPLIHSARKQIFSVCHPLQVRETLPKPGLPMGEHLLYLTVWGIPAGKGPGEHAELGCSHNDVTQLFAVNKILEFGVWLTFSNFMYMIKMIWIH